MGIRPDGDVAQVLALVREQFGGEAADVRPLPGGEFSRAYTVTVADRAYVVRLSAFASSTMSLGSAGGSSKRAT